MDVDTCYILILLIWTLYGPLFQGVTDRLLLSMYYKVGFLSFDLVGIKNRLCIDNKSIDT
jgi:hypothetical protein